MRKQFTMRLWNWKVLFHEAIYEFKTEFEAQNYLLGLYDGVRLTGQELTGMYMEEIK